MGWSTELFCNTAYLHGDFVKSTKYPTDKDLL